MIHKRAAVGPLVRRLRRASRKPPQGFSSSPPARKVRIPSSASASAQAKPRITLRPCRSIGPVTPEMYYFIAFSPNNPPGGGFSALSDGARGFFFPDTIIAHPENLSRGLYKILDEIFLLSRKVCRNSAGKSWGLWKCVPGNS